MNILGCLDRPTQGEYLFAGENVAHLGSDELAWLRREAFGFVFQGYHLIPSGSAQENVEMPAIYAGISAAERHARAMPCSRAWAWPSAPATARTSCPAASSSACRLPAR
jgi:macrolide transport system ATP-binding/permease protein